MFLEISENTQIHTYPSLHIEIRK